jgi:hypothetical protein
LTSWFAPSTFFVTDPDLAFSEAHLPFGANKWADRSLLHKEECFLSFKKLRDLGFISYMLKVKVKPPEKVPRVVCLRQPSSTGLDNQNQNQNQKLMKTSASLPRLPVVVGGGGMSRVMSRSSELRNPMCLPDDMEPLSMIGRGDYGSVWTIRKRANTRADPHWILKISNLDGDLERTEGYQRELLFLKRLQGTNLVPELKWSTICNGQGIQQMEKFDGSFQDMGQKQGQWFGLNEKTQVALTQDQIDKVVELVRAFDTFGVIHGDLKRGNLLQRNSGEKVVVADFGFSVVADFGFSGARDTKYYPLIGFTRHHGCPAETVVDADGITKLKVPVPKELLPYLNRWQIYTDFVNGRQTFIFKPNAAVKPRTAKLKRLSPKKLAKSLGLSPKIQSLFASYCNKF